SLPHRFGDAALTATCFRRWLSHRFEAASLRRCGSHCDDFAHWCISPLARRIASAMRLSLRHRLTEGTMRATKPHRFGDAALTATALVYDEVGYCRAASLRRCGSHCDSANILFWIGCPSRIAAAMRLSLRPRVVELAPPVLLPHRFGDAALTAT